MNRNTHKGPKPIFVTTPAGTAKYPRLNEPDTRFDEKGVYRVSLILEGEDAQQLADTLQNYYETVVSEFTTGKKKLREAPLPWESEVDEESGEETGRWIFKCKQKAIKVNPTTGNEEALFVQLVGPDAKPTDVQVGGGSVIKCHVMVTGWHVPALGVGISLRLLAVQVLEAKSYSGDAKSFGFRDETATYGTQDTVAQPAAEEESEEDFAF